MKVYCPVCPPSGSEEKIENEEEMDAQGIDWRFNNHARTPHSFGLAPGVWSNKYAHSWCLHVSSSYYRASFPSLRSLARAKRLF